jgi:hypothetical protein
MTTQTLINTGAFLAASYVVRLWARWRVERRKVIALTTPLVDAVLIETVFAARPTEGDDPDLLAEMRDTILHLNRQSYAEEFWGLHKQLSQLDDKLGPPQQATLRRAVTRLLETDDPWLQIVAAKTAADLRLATAVPRINELLDQVSGLNDHPAALRFSNELQAAVQSIGNNI